MAKGKMVLFKVKRVVIDSYFLLVPDEICGGEYENDELSFYFDDHCDEATWDNTETIRSDYLGAEIQ